MSKVEAEHYAWNWFALHSAQRLQLVNFWLIAVAFLVAGFVQAYSNHLYVVCLGVSSVGMISSLAFIGLDIRTRQLIRVAEDALRYFENQYAVDGLDEITMLVKSAADIRKSRFESYRTIIRGLQIIVAGFFTLAIFYSSFSI